MSRTRDWGVYGLLILLSVGFLGWQWFEHQRFSETARQRLLTISRNMTRSLEIIVGSQRRRHGIIPREPLEGALGALVENGPMRAIAVYNSDNQIIASSGTVQEAAHGTLAPGTAVWGEQTLTVVQLVQLGQFPRPPSKGNDEEQAETDPLILDRETAHQLMRDFFDKHRDELAADTAAGFEPSLRSFMHRMGTWRGNIAPETLRRYGLSKMVLTISTGIIDSHIQRDLWMRILLSTVFVLALAAVGWGWYTTRRTAALNLELVRAQEQNRHLREMNLAAAGLAHETKNPLNVIRSLAQTVKTSPDLPATARGDADLLITEVDAVTSRLNEFIEYSKPRQPAVAPVLLPELLNDVGRILQSDFDDKDIEFTVVADSQVVLADPALLRQAVFNLVLNACQVVADHGKIICRVTPAAAGVALCIADTGPGVPAAEREEIFRPYYSLRPDGTGLGLAVVNQIVQAHNWSVDCSAAGGGGACFTIRGMQAYIPDETA